jgi:ribosomal peptide maturation radical SAM protein 1
MITARATASLTREILGAERKDAVIIVPPFRGLHFPALGVHLLRAEAERAGFNVSILYANLLFAQAIGTKAYEAIVSADYLLFGEVCFRAAAFGRGESVDTLFVDETEFGAMSKYLNLDFSVFSEINRIAPEWCDELCAAIVDSSIPVVGCTTTFEQTCPSLAILRRIKELSPQTVTILGGANCEGEMADGILTLTDSIDHVFSGESEKTFISFLGGIASGTAPSARIIRAAPNKKLNELAVPTYHDFFDQRKTSLPDFNPSTIWIPYESSRGCWWGEKHNCTFCGLNGDGMGFREKSADIVVRDLQQIARDYSTRRVMMTDNIMPHSYYRSVLPRLADEKSDLVLFYELKANLNLENVELLRAAGVRLIQPGIEALSTPLLKLMKKGVRASQNIALLRYARSVDVGVVWNLMGAFPGDRIEWYRDTLEIMRYINHLPPPSNFRPVSIERFSPYHSVPESFGVSNVRAMPGYHRAFPATGDIEKIAYHFLADFESEFASDDTIRQDIDLVLLSWKQQWQGEGVPQLHITKITESDYILYDSRGIAGTREVEFIDAEQAFVSLWGARGASSQAVEWALDRSACLEIENEVVPLATADPILFHALQASFSVNGRATVQRNDELLLPMT